MVGPGLEARGAEVVGQRAQLSGCRSRGLGPPGGDPDLDLCAQQPCAAERVRGSTDHRIGDLGPRAVALAAGQEHECPARLRVAPERCCPLEERFGELEVAPQPVAFAVLVLGLRHRLDVQLTQLVHHHVRLLSGRGPVALGYQ